MKQPLFTRAFVLAAFATLMLSLAGFLFVHLPGFARNIYPFSVYGLPGI